MQLGACIARGICICGESRAHKTEAIVMRGTLRCVGVVDGVLNQATEIVFGAMEDEMEQQRHVMLLWETKWRCLSKCGAAICCKNMHRGLGLQSGTLFSCSYSFSPLYGIDRDAAGKAAANSNETEDDNH